MREIDLERGERGEGEGGGKSGGSVKGGTEEGEQLKDGALWGPAHTHRHT